MAEFQKYMFDFDFDDVKLMEEIVQEEIEEKKAAYSQVEHEPEPEITTFSEEEVEAARQEGYAAGKESGVQETLSGIESKVSQSLISIGSELAGMVQRQSEFNERLEADAMELALGVCRKLFPTLNEAGKLDEVMEMTKAMLGQLIEEPKITIRVEPEILDPFKDQIEPFLAENGYKGILSLHGDETLPVGGCKVEWTNGHAEKDPEETLTNIEQTVQTSLERRVASVPSTDETIADTFVEEGEFEEAAPEGLEKHSEKTAVDAEGESAMSLSAENSRDVESESASDIETEIVSVDTVEDDPELKG